MLQNITIYKKKKFWIILSGVVKEVLKCRTWLKKVVWWSPHPQTTYEMPNRYHVTLLPTFFHLPFHLQNNFKCLRLCILATNCPHLKSTESRWFSDLSRILPRWPLNWHDPPSLNFDPECHMNGDTISCLSFLPHQNFVTFDPLTQSFSQRCALWTFHLWPKRRQACVCFPSKDLWLILSNYAARAQSPHHNQVHCHTFM